MARAVIEVRHNGGRYDIKTDLGGIEGASADHLAKWAITRPPHDGKWHKATIRA